MSGEGIKDHCGVFGIFNHERATDITMLGLFALQHRGEESAGIASAHEGKVYLHKAMGLVGEVFQPEDLKRLPGRAAIGHVRYSTTGSTNLSNAQPYMVDYSRGTVAVAHNGNFTNAQLLRAELEAYGSIFGSTMDSEIFIHLMAKPSFRHVVDSVLGATRRVQGAYSMTLLTQSALFGIRDPHGFRPLCLGRLNGSYVIASETCALDLIGGEYIREIEPGEVVMIDDSGLESFHPFEGEELPKAHCVFEHVYFSRPDSIVFGENVALARERMGAVLAKEHPVDADVVVPVPDSGNFAALGYAKASGIPFAHGFTRNHYIGRTFINPNQEMRTFKVKIKLNPIREFVEGKRIVVVDDSIVRGNTSRSRVKLLRKAGAKEVHMRISCPPHVSPCYYGIDFPSKDELIACKNPIERIKEFLEVDSLGYLSREGMLSAVSLPVERYCTACFTGRYPTRISDSVSKYKLEGQVH